MDIVISALGMPFNGETIKHKSLGGSESAAYYLARELVRLGHRVTMFTTHDEEGSWDGVTYCNAGNITEAAPLGERFTFYAINTPHDVLIAQRHPLAFHKDFASKVNVWQLHDLALHHTTQMVHGGLPRVDFITAVSEFHAKQIAEVFSIPRASVVVVPNGVDPALYSVGAGSFFGPEAAPQFKMLYSSRPERGLEHLVRPGGIMDRLRGTAAHLYVCGYDNTVEQMRQYYGQLEAWAQALPNVTLLGALTKARLADLQKSCDLHCYPTEFEEVSCITAMEAMAAHLPLLTSHCGALPETCEGSGTILLPLRNGGVDEDAFVNTLQELIADYSDPDREGASRLGALRATQMRAAERVTWARAARVLTAALTRHLSKRADSPARVLRHCIEYSDIAFMDWYRDEHLMEGGLDAIAVNALRERDEMFRFIESPAALRDHYEHFEGANCLRMEREGLNIEAEIDSLNRSTRFIGIVRAMRQAMQGRAAGEPFSVLEFGCAHGHITLALARLFPDVTFTGVDFMSHSTRLAVNYAQQLNASNVTFVRGSLEDLPALGEKFDVVIAAEVIEHIYDYHSALETLRNESLAPGGAMIFTTPAGRWEWSGHDHFPKGREHLHHFEREDWLDILRGHSDYTITYAPFTADTAGGYRGSWVVRVNPEPDLGFGRVDYVRKLSTLAPRETVSACLIVKDAEDTIGKSLSTIARWVDEVVVALDPATKDDTRRVVGAVQNRFPWTPIRVIEGLEALRDGFGPARNRSLDSACGDWALWMDADEECPQAYNMWRRLRPSPFNAYGCPQIHYSAQPAQVLTTDYPARLFRRGRGVRFYGLVHEHPEDAPGKSIESCALAPDVQFLHMGYVDERTRRARYTRNLPLLLRDVQENPTRILNKFLLLRDLAQGIGFDLQNGGPTPDHAARASHGIGIMHEMILRDDVPLRMVLDGLQYYSICNELLGAGFMAKLSWSTGHPTKGALSASGTIEARMHDRATYMKLINRIAEESTKHYESKYA